MKQFYTVREIADLLAVSKTTIQKAIKANDITYQKIERNKQLYTIEQSNAIIKAVKADFPLLEIENSTTETANSTTKSENSTTETENKTANSQTFFENSTTKSENSQTKTANSTTEADNMGRMLDFIEKQAQEKDKLIADLQKELAEARAELAQKDAFIRSQSEQFAFLLEQSQKLQAGAQMLLLTDKTAEQKTEEAEPMKKSFFKRIFKK